MNGRSGCLLRNLDKTHSVKGCNLVFFVWQAELLTASSSQGIIAMCKGHLRTLKGTAISYDLIFKATFCVQMRQLGTLFTLHR